MKRAIAAIALVACGDRSRPAPPVVPPVARPHRAGRIVPGEAVIIGNALGTASLDQSSLPWSPKNTHVVFARGEDTIALHEPLALYVLDVRDHGVFRIAGSPKPLFSDDDRFLVSSDDRARTVTVYDLVTHTTVFRDRPIAMDPAFAPDGRLVWSTFANDEAQIFLRSLVDGRETVLRTRAEDPIMKLAFSPTGLMVTWDQFQAGPIRAWDPNRATPIATVEGDSTPDPTIDADNLFAYGTDGHVKFLDLANDRALELHSKHRDCGDGAIRQYAEFRRCSTRRYAWVAGTTVCIWDLATGKLATTIRAMENLTLACHDDIVEQIEEIPPGQTWSFSARTGKPIDHVVNPMNDFERVEPTTTGNEVIAVGDAQRELADSKGASDLAVSPDRSLVAGIAADGAARLWNSDGGLVWRGPRVPSALGVAFDANGRVVGIARDGRTWVIDLDARTATTAAGPRPCKLQDFDGPPLALTSRGIAMWCRADNGDERLVLGDADVVGAATTGRGWHAIVEPGFAAIVESGVTHLWSLPDGRKRWDATVLVGGADPIAISRDATRFAGVTFDDLAVWDASSWREQWRLPRDRTSGIAGFAPDGTTLLTAERFGSMTLRDAKTGAIVDEFEGGSAGFAFDPTSSRIAYQAPRWGMPGLHVRGGKHIVRVLAVDGPVDRPITQIAWSADGAQIAAVVAGSIYVWRDSIFAHATIHASGDDVAVVGGDDVWFAGNARDLLTCRIGDAVYPLERCDAN